MRTLVDDAILVDGKPHVVGRYFTKAGALKVARRLEEFIRKNPSEAKGLPRARHRVI